MGQAEAALSKDTLYTTKDMLVGDILRQARESYNQNLHDVERNLRIRACQIDAIEKNNFNELPGRVYTIGFVRSYAEYLGLDGDQIISILKKQFDVKSTDTTLDFPVAASEGKVPRLALIIASVLLSMIIVAFGTQILNQDRSLVEEIPPLSEEMRAQLPQQGTSSSDTLSTTKNAQAETSAETSAATPAAATSMTPAAALPLSSPPLEAALEPTGETIILNVVSNCWVEIKDAEGKTLVSRVLKEGERYSLPKDTTGLTISLGNAGGIELEIAGETLGTFGKSGAVLKSLSLDKNFLLETYTQNP